MWKEIQIKEIYWCWQKHIIWKNTKTKHNRNKTRHSTLRVPAPEVLTAGGQSLKASHLIHQDLHLHQPRVGVPRRPVGYHARKGNQGSGLTSEVLRERQRRGENQLTFRALCQEQSVQSFILKPWVSADCWRVDGSLTLPPLWCSSSMAHC